jgi:amino acid transporter
MAEPNGIHMDNISTSSQVDLHHDNASFVSSGSDVHRDLPDVIQDESKEDDNLRPTDVDRALKGYHIFFISVSGILGIGLYVRSANMLRLGGPGAVIVPFIILGLLAWMVMQCISEMLLTWPVSGALRLFVQKFVDRELGYAVSVAYWFTYSMSFAALISATAGEARVWPTVDQQKPIQAIVFFTLGWVVLLIFNMFSVRNYGRLEVLGGTLKLFFIFVVMIMMIAMNVGAGSCGYLGFKAYTTESFFSHDADQAGSGGQAFFMALQTAAFAFIGIEIPAVIAVEAEIMQPQGQDPERFTEIMASPPIRFLRRLANKFSLDNREPANAVLKFSAVYLPFWTACIYLFAGFFVTLNVSSSDHSLPSNVWEQTCRPEGVPLCKNQPKECTKSNSAFVISAYNAQIPGLPDAITVFLILPAFSSANTALYVASRTLYDLGKQVQVPERGSWHIKWPRKILSQFSKVGNRRVPHYALLASTAMFVWVPYLSLDGKSQNVEKVSLHIPHDAWYSG